MNLRFFIDRPVFSGVISVVIVLLGMISMFSLPVERNWRKHSTPPMRPVPPSIPILPSREFLDGLITAVA